MNITKITYIPVQTMRVIIIIALVTSFAFSIVAQNTFPSSGNVGIWTTSPTTLLNLNYGNSPTLRMTGNTFPSLQLLEANNTNPFYGFEIGCNAGPNKFEINRYDANGTAQNSLTIVRNNGYVGVDTTTPDTKLTVKGNDHILRLQPESGTQNSSLVFGAAPDGWNRAKILASGSSGDVSGDLRFVVNMAPGGTTTGPGDTAMTIRSTGNIGIGTTTPDAKLTVKGDIHAEEVTVDLSVPGPDYVFEEDYELTTLEETEAYIKTHKHLPEIPSAKEMEEEGIDLGTMNMLLLKKIEELTLHVIKQQKEIEILKLK